MPALIIMNVDEQLRNKLVAYAIYQGALEPEDVVHDVILRILDRNIKPKFVQYLKNAIRNGVADQYRTLKSRRTVRLVDALPDEYSQARGGQAMLSMDCLRYAEAQDFEDVVERLDLERLFLGNECIPGHGGVGSPPNRYRKNPLRKDLEIVLEYTERDRTATVKERVEAHRARRRLQNHIGANRGLH